MYETTWQTIFDYIFKTCILFILFRHYLSLTQHGTSFSQTCCLQKQDHRFTFFWIFIQNVQSVNQTFSMMHKWSVQWLNALTAPLPSAAIQLTLTYNCSLRSLPLTWVSYSVMISLSFLNFAGGFDIFNSDSKYQEFSYENVCKLVCLGAFLISRSVYRGQCIPEMFQVAQAKKIPKAKRRKCSSSEFPTIPNVIPPSVRSKHSAHGKSFLPK